MKRPRVVNNTDPCNVRKRPACEAFVVRSGAYAQLPEFAFEGLLALLRSAEFHAKAWRSDSASLSLTCKASWQAWLSLRVSNAEGVCGADALLHLCGGRRKVSRQFDVLEGRPRGFPLQVLPMEMNMIAKAFRCLPRSVCHVHTFLGGLHFTARECKEWRQMFAGGRDTTIISDMCRVGGLTVRLALHDLHESVGDGVLHGSFVVGKPDSVRVNDREVRFVC